MVSCLLFIVMDRENGKKKGITKIWGSLFSSTSGPLSSTQETVREKKRTKSNIKGGDRHLHPRPSCHPCSRIVVFEVRIKVPGQRFSST